MEKAGASQDAGASTRERCGKAYTRSVAGSVSRRCCLSVLQQAKPVGCQFSKPRALVAEWLARAARQAAAATYDAHAASLLLEEVGE